MLGIFVFFAWLWLHWLGHQPGNALFTHPQRPHKLFFAVESAVFQNKARSELLLYP